MKKQSLSALLLATALLATGFVSSCKDNDSDLFTELDRELTDQATLSQALQAQIDELQSKISVLEAKKECTCQMTEEWKKVLSTGSFDQAFSDTWYAYYSNLYATSEAVKAAADKAQEALTYAENLAAQVEKNAADIVTLDGKITTLNTLLETAQKTADEAKQLAGDALSKADAAQITADSALALAKQNQSDLADLSSNLTTLTNRVNVISDRLQVVADSAALAYGKAVELDGKYSALRFTVDSLGNVVTAYGDTLNVMGVRVDSLNTVVTTYSYRIDSLGNVVDQFDNRISTVEYKVDSLGNVTTSLDSKINSAISTLRNEAATNLQLAYNYTDRQVASFLTTIDTKIGELRNELKPFIDANTDSIDSLRVIVLNNKLRIDTLATTVDELASELATLSDEVKDLKTDFSNLITGIIIQGTDDPVFGYMALPFGIQTNILAAYYGSITKDVKFPKNLTANEVSAIGTVNTKTFSAGDVLISDSVGNAGKIYLTINPTNIDFTGKSFNLILENSRGEASKIELKNIQKSDALLTFGVTRAGNGFYEADAYLAADDAASVAPSIDLTDFKTVAKDLLNNHTFDISTAVSAVYNAVNCKLPRYAAKTYWTNSQDEEVAVYSNYAIAATSLKPLSFSFLENLNVSTPKIPHIDTKVIDDALDNMTSDIKVELKFAELELGLDDLDIDFNVEVPTLSLKIEWQDIDFSDKGDTIFVPYAYVEPQYEVEILYTDDTKTSIKEINLNKIGEDSVKTIIPVTGMNEIYSSIAKQVNDRMKVVMSTINNFSDDLGSFTTQMQNAIDQLKKLQDFTTKISGLQEQINKVLNSANASLDTTVKDLVASIKTNLTGTLNNYVGTINNYIDKVNTVLNRVTGIINNLNSKLQPALLYKTTSGSLAVVSTAKAFPTQVTVSGGSAMELLPTTYTAEILAPAYKKYVAVTNVFNGSKSAQDGDAQCKAALAAANETEFFNTVIDGNQRVVAFTSGSQYQGYIYEVTYTALDYTGVESSKKFYLQIR
jgi:ABC-type transporter Mla subunit MlaD